MSLQLASSKKTGKMYFRSRVEEYQKNQSPRQKWNSGYKETYLIGADTSFIQDIYVGQKDNVLYTVDTHFYKNKDVYDCDFEPEKHGRKFGMDMEKFLDSVYKMFQSYKELRQYADWKMVKVYNASEYSLIDCFERKKLR